MRQRWYDAALQRFVSRDALRGNNRYSYALNRPTIMLDPTGLDTIVIVSGGYLGNPLGHVTIGVTGAGIYDPNGTAAGTMWNLTGYLPGQVNRRDVALYIIKTNSTQEAAILMYLRSHQKPFGIPFDTCAKRTTDALIAGGYGYDDALRGLYNEIKGYPGLSEFGYDFLPAHPLIMAWYAALLTGGTTALIPRGTQDLTPYITKYHLNTFDLPQHWVPYLNTR